MEKANRKPVLLRESARPAPRSLTAFLPGSAAMSGRWAQALRHAGAGLDRLNQGSEREFLALGKHLEHFHRQAQTITRHSREVAEMLSGGALDSAVQRLGELLATIRTGMTGTAAEVQTLTRNLEDVGKSLESVRGPLEAFGQTVSMLRMLGVATRIESARIQSGDSGFGTLSDEVKKLSITIEERSTAIMERCSGLLAVIRQTLAKVRGLDARYRKEADEVLSAAQASLEALVERNSRSRQAADSIAHRAAAMETSIGEIVASMQFHDITRQRLEHVQEALLEITREGEGIGWFGRILWLFGRQPWVGKAAGTCALQVVQLRFASGELVEAVDAIGQNLKDIGRQAQEMTGDIQGMAGSARTEEDSVLGEIEAGVASVAQSLAGIAGLRQELGSAVQSMRGTVGEIGVFVREIERIGAEIKLISLNAIIKAAHIGDEGRALGVIAGAIQRLANDSVSQTDIVAKTLRQMAARATEMDAETGAGQGLSMEETSAALKALLQDLRSLGGGVQEAMRHVGIEVQEFVEEIDRVAGGLTVHHRMETAIGKVAVRIEDTVTRDLRSVMSGKTDLVALEARYTMEQERRVHVRHLGELGQVVPPHPSVGKPGSQPSLPGASPSGEKPEEGTFGDNVELF